ncbi:hypothetical protein LJR231_000990 [Phyllobacterium sp. LjRoot231]|uniref:hypothetical protein n=1 Tax=Phyllobacterium sp. LjRoot231 TaxID=3342289 RepID=UPI003ED0CA99
MELKGMRLLVLEDEYLIGLELERIAEECEAQSVDLVSTVDELVAWIDSEAECDIAIIEVQAHGISSLRAASRLQLRGVPVVFTTAYDVETGGIDGFAGVPVVGKPYGKNQIVKAVAAAR